MIEDTQFEVDHLLASEYVIISAINNSNYTINEIKDYLDNFTILPVKLSVSRIYKILTSLEDKNIVEKRKLRNNKSVNKYLLKFEVILNMGIDIENNQSI